MSNGLKPWEPTKLNARHKHIAALTALGWKGHEVAKAIGMCESRVSVVKNTPSVQALIEQMTKDFADEISMETAAYIKAHTMEAAETMVQLMRFSKSENIRRLSAADVLDRGGHKPKETVQHQHVEISTDAAEKLTIAMQEALQPEEELEFVEDSAGAFIEGEFEVEIAGSRESTD